MRLNIIYIFTGLLLGFALGRFFPVQTVAPIQYGTSEASTKKTSFTDLPQLSGKNVLFSQLIQETRHLTIIPFDENSTIHQAIKKVILSAAEECRAEFSASDSPLREVSRINEASRYFEDRLREKIDASVEFSCGIPLTSSGKEQRSGYPDLRIEHLSSGTVAYLDPKLFAAKSVDSSFRTFYYEPANDSGKITENALHLLLGFPHDSKTRAWTFSEPHLIDLSSLQVTLKAEFHASNKELYDGHMDLSSQPTAN